MTPQPQAPASLEAWKLVLHVEDLQPSGGVRPSTVIKCILEKSQTGNWEYPSKYADSPGHPCSECVQEEQVLVVQHGGVWLCELT